MNNQMHIKRSLKRRVAQPAHQVTPARSVPAVVSLTRAAPSSRAPARGTALIHLLLKPFSLKPLHWLCCIAHCTVAACPQVWRVGQAAGHAAAPSGCTRRDCPGRPPVRGGAVPCWAQPGAGGSRGGSQPAAARAGGCDCLRPGSQVAVSGAPVQFDNTAAAAVRAAQQPMC